MSKRAKAYFFLIVSTITWGAFLPIVKLGFNDSAITPFRYLLYRFILAAILISPVLWHYFKKIKNKWRTIRTIFLLEIIETSLALSCLYIGLSLTSALETNLIASSLPLFVIFGGIIFLKEKETKREWLGLIFAIFGTALITLEPLWRGGEQFSGSIWGNLLIIAHNILTAIYFILAKKHYKKIPKIFVSGISFLVGVITFGLLSLLEANFNLTALLGGVKTDLSSPLVWGVIIYAAVFGSIVGLTAYIYGQNEIEASEASLFTYLQPAIYVPLGYLLLRESVTILQIFALLIVIGGVYIAGRK
jgi:drug/metabolite transporter (DMT)-like permease